MFAQLNSDFIALIALFVSVFALFFSGLLQELWRRMVGRPRLSVTLASIEFGADEGIELPANLPRDLVQKSKKARFFPSIKEEMTVSEIRGKINDFERKDYPGTLLKIKNIDRQIAEMEDDDDITELWRKLDSNESSTALTYATTKANYNREQNTLEAKLEAVLESVTKSGSKPSNLGMLAAAKAVESFKETLFKFSTRPTAGLFREYITVCIPEMEENTHSDVQFVNQLKEAIAQADSTDTADYRWRLMVQFYNSGERSVSISPVGAMIVSNFDAKSVILGMSVEDEHIMASPCSPGSSTQITFVTHFDAEQRDILKSLSQDFYQNKRSFKIAVKINNKKLLTSDKLQFSPASSKNNTKDLLDQISSSKIRNI